MTSPSRTIYLIDDNDEFRDSAAFWLDAAGYQVRPLSNPEEALQAMAEHEPGAQACVLMDVRMPELSGLDLHDRMADRGLRLPVVYMSGHADVALTVRAMRKGAVSLLEKPLDEAALDDALQSAFQLSIGSPPHASAGERAAPPAAPPAEAPAAPDPRDAEFVRREAALAPRERAVLALVVQGIYNKNIADRLGLSVKTIELYRARGMAKMGAKSVAELTRMMVSRQA